MNLELHGKRALVTGGSRGIGKAAGRELCQEGARVILVGRDEPALAAAAQEMGAEGWLRCDTGLDEQVERMAEQAVAQLGGLDILVNCAAKPGGQSRPPRLSEMTNELFWDDVNVKVLGYLRCIRALAPHMQPGSRIVNVSGLAARSTGSTIGSIRNIAVAAMTKNLADELAPAGISVVCVHPGTTRTEKTPAVLRARAASQGISEEEAERQLAAANLLGRLVDANEVAAVIAFLASPRAVGINGDSVPVAGGIRGPIYY